MTDPPAAPGAEPMDDDPIRAILLALDAPASRRRFESQAQERAARLVHLAAIDVLREDRAGRGETTGELAAQIEVLERELGFRDDDRPALIPGSWQNRATTRFLARAAPQSKPIACIIVGPRGPCRGAVGRAAAETLRGRGGAVLIDHEELTLLHPVALGPADEGASGPSVAANSEIEDASAALLGRTVESKFDLVLAARPSSRDDQVVRLGWLHASGYRVVVLAVELHPEHARAALRERDEHFKKSTGVEYPSSASVDDDPGEVTEVLGVIADRSLAVEVHRIGAIALPSLVRPQPLVDPASPSSGRKLKIGNFGVTETKRAPAARTAIPGPESRDRRREVKIGSREASPGLGPVRRDSPPIAAPSPSSASREVPPPETARLSAEEHRAIVRRLGLQEKLRRRARRDRE